jgi:FAD/FMN-containing dehydrogenase
VLEGFGRSTRAACRTVAPRSEAEVLELFEQAKREGLSLAFRGAGRSYGDAALNGRGLVMDMRGLDRMLNWDAEHGIVEAQGGLTIEGLWRRTLEDGYWPAVVPGTMAPTLAGCLSMNIHGKNHFAVGPIGDHVLDFDLLTPNGQKLRCSPTENADVFRAAIGGLGLLGAITRVRLKLKKVESGYLRVTPLMTRSLEETFDAFEARLGNSDYLVGWTDCMASGSSLGRSQIHQAHYLPGSEDPDGRASLHVERQGLPDKIMGVPKSVLWRFMKPFGARPLWRMVNVAKYWAGRLGSHEPYLQSHVAFAFLLDYVPNWRLAYGDSGFIQVQVFLPAATARMAMREILTTARDRGLPSYLSVFKRHRSDDFLLSHALDGYSMAMDFPVRPHQREEMWKLAHDLHGLTLNAGGRIYFAKDSVLNLAEVQRAYGAEKLSTFAALKARLDPSGMLESDLARRALGLGSPEPVRASNAEAVPMGALPSAVEAT